MAEDMPKDPVDVAVGARMRALRVATGLTQKELADRRPSWRTNCSTLRATGHVFISATCWNIAFVLDVPLAALLEDFAPTPRWVAQDPQRLLYIVGARQGLVGYFFGDEIQPGSISGRQTGTGPRTSATGALSANWSATYRRRLLPATVSRSPASAAFRTRASTQCHRRQSAARACGPLTAGT